ncbi:MAG: GNAT family N-acetyltransferase [Anaerolineae bacterium]|nr:GNAT family N-acetyltransferase [Anaerolineae bacterium]MCA9892599.1 GNAT family N-acetyltransferase [Anaerolineae bacterium]
MEATKTSLIVDLPEGYSSRITTPDDAEAFAKILEADSLSIGITRKFDADEIRDDWTSPDFVLEESARSVLDSTGNLVGIVTVWDTGRPPVHPFLSLVIHPDHMQSGVGEAMLAWGEERAKLAIDRCPPGSRVSIRSNANDLHETRKAMLEAFGMEKVRYFFRMLINMDEAPPAPQLPDGYIIRPIQYPEELEKTVRAVMDAFKDHWGFVEEPIEVALKDWQHHIEIDKLFDPSEWFLAIDEITGEIAGFSLCRSEHWSDPSVAYVFELGVRREHRRKGIALALLHHVFGEYWRRGRKDVALHVDASSLTGAVKLYEKAGMRQDERSVAYDKLLRDGEEMMTTSAE